MALAAAFEKRVRDVLEDARGHVAAVMRRRSRQQRLLLRGGGYS
ncbi:MAG TPA: hypothetical protein VLF42_13700 [Burkholderiales bacterium]|nr:hypothetical protein [Burkholderiales bacterium]